MEWKILFDQACGLWFLELDEGLREEIAAHIELLRAHGPNLGRPRVDTVKGSAFPNMKELRVQYQGQPWRLLFAFDPHRKAIFLVGGNKRSDKRWYKTFIPIADSRYASHLARLTQTE